MKTNRNETRNTFISHIHEDDDGLKDLKSLLQEHGMTIRDYSITSDNPNNAHSEDYIKASILAPRIRMCPIFLVYVSAETLDSEFVEWEIEYAHKNDRRIVGIWARGESGCEVPYALNKYADAVVAWNADSILAAIDGEINGWQNPDGTVANPRDIDRYRCK